VRTPAQVENFLAGSSGHARSCITRRSETGWICEAFVLREWLIARGDASLLLKHDHDDFDCLIVASFLLTPPRLKRKISATSLKSKPRNL
jgi:hypothetical protein